MSDETDTTSSPSYSIDTRNRVRRVPQRGAYDHETVHALLDAAMLAHIAYVIDGQPYCTPTFYWRDGNRVFWHGSALSRMLQHQAGGVAVCVTVTQLDSLVLARSPFHHSADYRSVMAFGTAHLVDDPDRKEQALVAMVDRFFADRTASLRPSTRQELGITSVIEMEIEQASAKVREAGIVDDEVDYELPIHAEVIPIRQVLGEPEPCQRLLDGVGRPASLDGYVAGRRLDEVLSEAHRRWSGASTAMG